MSIYDKQKQSFITYLSKILYHSAAVMAKNELTKLLKFKQSYLNRVPLIIL